MYALIALALLSAPGDKVPVTRVPSTMHTATAVVEKPAPVLEAATAAPETTVKIEIPGKTFTVEKGSATEEHWTRVKPIVREILSSDTFRGAHWHFHNGTGAVYCPLIQKWAQRDAHSGDVKVWDFKVNDWVKWDGLYSHPAPTLDVLSK